MMFRKMADWLIKLLGGYTPLDYAAVHSLYLDYKRGYFKYRDLVGTLDKLEHKINAISEIVMNGETFQNVEHLEPISDESSLAVGKE